MLLQNQIRCRESGTLLSVNSMQPEKQQPLREQLFGKQMPFREKLVEFRDMNELKKPTFQYTKPIEPPTVMEFQELNEEEAELITPETT